MQATLGINTGFAVNRFTDPDQWIPLVAQEFQLDRVQFTADLLNASLPDSLVKKLAERTRKRAAEYGIRIESAFTGAFTRVNHFSHPDADVRSYWQGWFRKFVDIGVILGVHSVGSHFGILTMPDLHDPVVRKERFQQTLDNWLQLAEYAAERGIRNLTWEPMSIAREYGETISEARKIQDEIDRSSPAIPILMCLDVDHGDPTSSDPEDTDPYAWIRNFARCSSQIHLKQSYHDKGGHWPFTAEHNARGKIDPDRVLDSLKNSGATQIELYLELSFREREPFDSRMVQDIKESVSFWKPYVN